MTEFLELRRRYALACEDMKTRRAELVAQYAQTAERGRVLLEEIAAIDVALADVEPKLQQADAVPVDPSGAAGEVATEWDALFGDDTPTATVVLGVVAYSPQGIEPAALIARVRRVRPALDSNALHTAIHRLKGAGLLEQTHEGRGAPYKLTTKGSREWTVRFKAWEARQQQGRDEE